MDSAQKNEVVIEKNSFQNQKQLQSEAQQSQQNQTEQDNQNINLVNKQEENNEQFLNSVSFDTMTYDKYQELIVRLELPQCEQHKIEKGYIYLNRENQFYEVVCKDCKKEIKQKNKEIEFQRVKDWILDISQICYREKQKYEKIQQDLEERKKSEGNEQQDLFKQKIDFLINLRSQFISVLENLDQDVAALDGQLSALNKGCQEQQFQKILQQIFDLIFSQLRGQKQEFFNNFFQEMSFCIRQDKSGKISLTQTIKTNEDEFTNLQKKIESIQKICFPPKNLQVNFIVQEQENSNEKGYFSQTQIQEIIQTKIDEQTKLIEAHYQNIIKTLKRQFENRLNKTLEEKLQQQKQQMEKKHQKDLLSLNKNNSPDKVLEKIQNSLRSSSNFSQFSPSEQKKFEFNNSNLIKRPLSSLSNQTVVLNQILENNQNSNLIQKNSSNLSDSINSDDGNSRYKRISQNQIAFSPSQKQIQFLQVQQRNQQILSTNNLIQNSNSCFSEDQNLEYGNAPKILNFNLKKQKKFNFSLKPPKSIEFQERLLKIYQPQLSSRNTIYSKHEHFNTIKSPRNSSLNKKYIQHKQNQQSYQDLYVQNMRQNPNDKSFRKLIENNNYFTQNCLDGTRINTSIRPPSGNVQKRQRSITQSRPATSKSKRSITNQYL